MKTEILSTRIDPDIKNNFNNICDSIGLSPSQAIKLFVHGVINHGGIPFELKAKQPNQASIAAMEELQQGKGHKSKNVQELLTDLTDGKIDNA
ncbi:MAG: type II toxin-antitoxin system RelB/DinJ family antitoxin [Desulfotalea sp.]